MTNKNVSKEKVVDDLKTLVSDAEDLVKAAATNVADKSKDELKTALEKLKVSCRRIEDRAVSGAEATNEVIRGHPYESIGIAFGLGLLAGVLLTKH